MTGAAHLAVVRHDPAAADDLARFAKVVSHDFSAPLRAIRGFASLLVDSLSERIDDDERSYLGHILSATTRMQALNDGLVACLRARSASLEITEVSLDSVLKDCLDELGSRIADQRARVTASSLPVVRADRATIRLVLHHLLDNALRYADAGGTATIDITATRGATDWTIAVRDNGPGIVETSRERVLTLFKRLEPARDPDRPGVGLTLSQTIVERHGGRLWIDAAPGGGTEVAFTLPIGAATAPRVASIGRPSSVYLGDQFQTFLDISPDAIVIIDTDGTIAFVNGQAEAVFRRRRADMVGRRVEMLLPERLREAHTRHRLRYLAEPRTRPMGFGLGLTGLRGDGSEFPVDISLSPMQTGEQIFLVAAIRDISEREHLVESRAALAAIVESSDDAIISKDLDGLIITWNSAAEKLYGFCAQEAIGQHVSIVMPPDRLDELPMLLDRTRTGVRVDHLETIRMRKDGSLIDVSLTVSPVRDARGEVVAASVIARDVTDRRRAEEELRSFLEFAPDAIVIIDREGSITAVNAQTEAVFGYGRDELLGQRLEMLLPERLRDRHAGHRLAFTASPKTRPMGAGLDLYGLRRDGTEFPVDIQLSSLPTKDGVLPVAAIRDVTERRRLENLRDEFIRNAAHELRTPLTTLAGLGETLAGSFDVMRRADIDEALAAMTRQGERARVLIANLLDLSQLEGERADFTVVEVELGPLLDRVLEAAPPPDGKSVTVAVPPDLTVHADPIRLEQVVTNLLVNAYRYGGTEIWIEASPHESQATISVADNGRGVAPDLAPKLFEPFTRGREASVVGGSGIGLALCRHIVQAMGGKIWHEALLPRGTSFHVSVRRHR